MGLMYSSRLLGKPLPEMLSGPLLLEQLMRHAGEKGYSVFLLGSKPEIVRMAVDRYSVRYPTMRIVGYLDGYFTRQEEPTVVAGVRDSQPDLLFVEIGTPRAETFIREHLHEMKVPVSLDVGGAFDVAASVYKLVPYWMRKLCLEWFYRFLQEPRRLWKRYAITNTVFIYLVIEAFARHLFRLLAIGLNQRTSKNDSHDEN